MSWQIVAMSKPAGADADVKGWVHQDGKWSQAEPLPPGRLIAPVACTCGRNVEGDWHAKGCPLRTGTQDGTQDENEGPDRA